MTTVAPLGSVTLMFTDIEGSTKLLERLRDRYAVVLEQHRDLMRAGFDLWGGYEVDTQGDSFFVAFGSAAAAVSCSVEAQRSLAAHPWPDGASVRVRIGIHTGDPILAPTGYVGLDVHRAARIGAAAHGGQILVSAATRAALDGASDGVELAPMGVHRFKGLEEPLTLFQVTASGLEVDFPPVRTAAAADEPPSPGESPYKGLLRFDEADADRYFGREEIVARLMDAVAAAPFVAIVGASGSGKSSLVRAGLIPALVAASTRVALMTPSANPMGAAAAALAGGSPGADADGQVLEALRRDPASLRSELRAAVASQRGVLVVDQFEELFTQCRDPSERTRFIAALAPDADDAASCVVITLRADFYGQLAEYQELRAAVAEHQLYIGPMDPEDLRRAIEQPARLGGWEIAPGLVDLLLRDIGSEPGALPLLSHALLETWRRRRGSAMVLKGYFEAGEVRGAIARTADRVFDSLGADDRFRARDMLLRLTELGEETQDTRRRARLDELVPMPGSEGAEAATRVLQTLVDARLVTVDEASAEVAHEALIREWPLLREWLREDREGLRIHRQVTDAAAEWRSLGHDASLLFRGARLATATEWAAAHATTVSALEREFLEASTAAEHAEARERLERQERELEAARRAADAERRRAEEQTASARRLRRRAVVLAGAVVLAVGLGATAALFARQATDRAAEAAAEANRATVRELANAADLSLQVDPERSVLLALEAVRRGGGDGGGPMPEAEEALHRAVQASRVEATMVGGGGEIVGGAISPDGTVAATLSVDGSLQAWDAESGALLATVPLDTAQPSKTTTLSFSPDGTRLAVPSGNRVRIFGTDSWEEVAAWEAQEGLVTCAVFSPDGSQLATGGVDEDVRVWDAASGAPLATINVSDEPDPDGFAEVLSLAYLPDGLRIVAGLLDDRPDHVGSAKVFHVTTGQLAGQFAEGEPIAGVAVSPDGTRLATGDWGTVTSTWDLDSEDWVYSLYESRSLINGVAISPDGSRLASASADGATRIVDLATGREVAVMAGHTTAVFAVAFSADGFRLLTTSGDGTARTWDVSPSGGAEWAVLPMGDRVWRVAYSPDGRSMATGTATADGRVAVWEPNGELRSETAAPGSVWGLVYSGDGATLYEGRDETVTVRDVETGVARATLPIPVLGGDLALSHDDRYLAAASEGLVTVWDLEAGAPILLIDDLPGELSGVAFSPDGSSLAVSAQSGTAAVYRLPDGALRFELVGHTGPVRRVRFSPDGTLIATGSNDGTARVWDATDGRLLHTLAGHTSPVYGLDFSPDGTVLATGSIDATVKLWTVADLEANPITLGGHRAAIYDVRFSPDAARLITGSRDLTARVFAIAIDDLVALAESKVTRSLTDAECQRYLHVETCPGG